MGRRRKLDDARTSSVVVRLTKTERKAFKELSERSGKSLSRLIREALMREYMNMISGNF